MTISMTYVLSALEFEGPDDCRRGGWCRSIPASLAPAGAVSGNSPAPGSALFCAVTSSRRTVSIVVVITFEASHMKSPRRPSLTIMVADMLRDSESTACLSGQAGSDPDIARRTTTYGAGYPLALHTSIAFFHVRKWTSNAVTRGATQSRSNTSASSPTYGCTQLGWCSGGTVAIRSRSHCRPQQFNSLPAKLRTDACWNTGWRKASTATIRFPSRYSSESESGRLLAPNAVSLFRDRSSTVMCTSAKAPAATRSIEFRDTFRNCSRNADRNRAGSCESRQPERSSARTVALANTELCTSPIALCDKSSRSSWMSMKTRGSM